MFLRLLSLVIVLMTSSYAQAGIRERSSVEARFYVGAWEGSASYGSDGTFAYCMVTATYRSGVALAFVVDRDFAFHVMAHSGSWSLTPGVTVPLTLEIDRYRPMNVSGYVETAQVVSIEFGDAERLFDLLRRGYVLRVHGSTGSLSFDLTDTYRALTRLLNCASDRVQEEALQRGGGNPFFRSQTQPGQSSATSATSPQQIADITVFVTNLLSRSGLSNFTMRAGHQLPPELERFDVVWTSPEIAGAATFVSDVDGFGVREIASLLIAADNQECDAEFASGSSSVSSGGILMKRVFTACKAADSEPVQSTYYSIFPWPGGSLTISHAPLASGTREQAEHTDEVLFKTASHMLTE